MADPVRISAGRVSRTYAESASDEEDLRQEILLQLWRSLPRFNGLCRESTWIYQVALNVALTWSRRVTRRPNEEPLRADPPSAVDESIPVERRLLVDRLYRTIRALDPGSRSLALLHLDGMSHGEIASVLGISENYVAVKLHRLRKRLAEMWRS